MEDQHFSQTPPAIPEPESFNNDIPPLKPNNWLWQSILATLFCCNVLGVVGVVYAARVDALYNGARYAEAEKAAKSARTWTLVALAIGIVYLISWVAMFTNEEMMSTMKGIIENNASGYNF